MTTTKKEYKRKSFQFSMDLYKEIKKAAEKEDRNVYAYIIRLLKKIHKPK